MVSFHLVRHYVQVYGISYINNKKIHSIKPYICSGTEWILIFIVDLRVRYSNMATFGSVRRICTKFLLNNGVQTNFPKPTYATRWMSSGNDVIYVNA